MLLAASFDADAMALGVTFDRAVDTDSAVPGAFVVTYPPFYYYGVLAVNAGPPGQVSVQMAQGDPFEGGESTLTASSDNGLTAVDDGGTWAGISAAPLPYPPEPPTAPTLIEASYDADAATVTLVFDQAIDVTNINVGEIGVGDATAGQLMAGSGEAYQQFPDRVRVDLVVVEPWSGEATELSSGGAGIISADNSMPWDGVSELALPYP